MTENDKKSSITYADGFLRTYLVDFLLPKGYTKSFNSFI